jgi:hypothetical protein
MSQISKAIFGKAIFGALAVSVACGAVQLAFGHDLTGMGQAASAAPETGINRAAKADRAAVKPAAQTRTVALRINGMPDTSVLVRMPAAKESVREEARDRPAPSMMKSGDRKTAIACEPVVSVLTEVAKLLQPGRCVT